jgi:hypothetical protein
VSVEQQEKTEGLWRLHGPEARPIRSRDNLGPAADYLDCIGNGRSRNGSILALSGLDCSVDEFRACEGASRVMDEDDVWG